MNEVDRQRNNGLILKHLEEIVEKYPDIRFGQLLNNLRTVNDTRLFYEEPDETLKTVNKNKDQFYD